MECPSCAHDNPSGGKFCGGCGAPLVVACRGCGHASQPGQRFCGECGQRLDVESPPRRGRIGTAMSAGGAERAVELPAEEVERRHLTVMFCDLVGSTSLSEQLDPEDLREVVRRYQEAGEAVVARFAGYVSQFLGDGFLVYFGYPKAGEDDAIRAVRAGLRVVEAASALQTGLGGVATPLRVRVGIHSGLVVVGRMGDAARHEPLALGMTPNVAARLQDLAEPNRVLISADTYQLVWRRFACRDLGPRSLRGVTVPIHVHEVAGEIDPQLARGPGPRVVPLIGREPELESLREQWRQARAGEGGIVLLAGEPGIGKSRLVQAFTEGLGAEPHVHWECRCSPDHQDSALQPVIELFSRVFDLPVADGAEGRARQIASWLDRGRLARPESVALWVSLLGDPTTPATWPVPLPPEDYRRRMFQEILSLVRATAARAPLLLVVEDVHWADASTLALLGLLADASVNLPILVLLVCRPGIRPEWSRDARVTELVLTRLTRRQAELMIEGLAPGRPLPTVVVDQIVQRTDGVPLFIEELSRMVIESGLLRHAGEGYELSGPLLPLGIPSTLDDSLMARLDRLGPAKELAQLCSVLGRSFPHELVRDVSDLDGATLDRELRRLVDADLLHLEGLPPGTTYRFKHVLLQEAAYRSLLKRRRQHYHLRVASVLKKRAPDAQGVPPEILAHHYAEAGRAEDALPYYQAAGERAIGRSANAEAVAHLTRGLELLRGLPRAPEQEIRLQVALGAALIATKGYAAPEVEAAYTRARELCRDVGDTPHLFAVLRGLAAFYYVRGDLHAARGLGEQSLALARRQEDLALRVGAHLELGSTLFNLGQFQAARAHFEQGIALYDPRNDRVRAEAYGQDLGVSCLARLAVVLACLGYLDQARDQSQEALRLARDRAHPYTRAYALSFAAVVHRLRREPEVVHDLAEATLVLATEHGFPFWTCVGRVLEGWSLAERGRPDDGVALVREAIRAWRALGAEVSTTYFLTELAEGCRAMGRNEEALAAVDEAIGLGERTGDRWQESVLYRLRGELLLDAQASGSGGDAGAAEACLRRALAIAREQAATVFELTAALSLGRVLRGQGRTEEARGLVAIALDGVTEGHGTAEVSRARSLLDVGIAG